VEASFCSHPSEMAGRRAVGQDGQPIKAGGIRQLEPENQTAVPLWRSSGATGKRRPGDPRFASEPERRRGDGRPVCAHGEITRCRRIVHDTDPSATERYQKPLRPADRKRVAAPKRPASLSRASPC